MGNNKPQNKMGCTIQMVAIGTQGAKLVATTGQCLSFWKNKYSLTCNSCTNSVEHQFSGQVGFNRWLNANLVRQGDLIKSVTAVFGLPGLAPCGDDAWAHWNNNIAYTIAQEVQWDIGGTLVARSYGDALRVQDELTRPALKDQHEATGSAPTRQTLIDWAQWVSKLYYLRLSSWIDWNTGNALPICAMMQQTMTIKILTCPQAVAYVTGPVGAAPLALTPAKGTYQQINDQTLNAFLYVDWVTLDERERDTYTDQPLTYLMYQVQRQSTCMPCASMTSMQQRIEMNFQHPVFLLAWYVATQDNVRNKNVWNWSGHNGNDPVISCQIKSNQDEFFSERDALYFRTVLNSLVGLNSPEIYTYIWSFATFPFKFQPSGFLNMSRVDGMALYLRVQPQIRDAIVTILAWNYNWFNVERQYGTNEFSGC